jgi:hypothetical protein
MASQWEILTAHQPRILSSQPRIRPVRTCYTYNFKGALRAPGWPPSMRKRRAMAALTVERRSFRP